MVQFGKANFVKKKSTHIFYKIILPTNLAPASCKNIVPFVRPDETV